MEPPSSELSWEIGGTTVAEPSDRLRRAHTSDIHLASSRRGARGPWPPMQAPRVLSFKKSRMGTERRHRGRARHASGRRRGTFSARGPLGSSVFSERDPDLGSSSAIVEAATWPRASGKAAQGA